MVDKTTVDKDVSWIGARLREPSTYAGLGVLVALVFPHFAGASEAVKDIAAIGGGIGALIAIFLPE